MLDLNVITADRINAFAITADMYCPRCYRKMVWWYETERREHFRCGHCGNEWHGNKGSGGVAPERSGQGRSDEGPSQAKGL